MSGLTMGMGDYMQVGPAVRFVGPNAAQVIMRGPHGMRLAADPVKTREGRVRGSGFRFWAEQELPFLEKHQSWNPGQRVVGLMGLGSSDNPSAADLRKDAAAQRAMAAANKSNPGVYQLHMQLARDFDRAADEEEARAKADESDPDPFYARLRAAEAEGSRDNFSVSSSNGGDGGFSARLKAARLEREAREAREAAAREARETAQRRVARPVASTQPAKATNPWWRPSAKEKAREGGRTTLGTDELKISLNTGGSGSVSTPVMVGVAVVGTLGALAALKVLIGGRS